MQTFGDFKTSVKRALSEIDPNYESYEGLIICGSHSPRIEEIDFLLEKIWDARVSGLPFLGICYGHQLAAIEYAKNVLLIKDATSEEFGQGTFVVKKLPQLKVGGYYEDGSRWNNYEVVIETHYPDNFFTTQSHPEYESMVGKPHLLLEKFIIYCKKYGQNSLASK